MARFKDRSSYFTRHLFGAGLECPTKLYYYARNYPQDQSSKPFIAHAIYNKRLLTALARSVHSEGIFVSGKKVSQASRLTKKLLEKDEVVLFDAVFEHEQMMARLPIIRKEGDQITAFYVRTKAFDSRKHRLTDSSGRINGKWQKYVLDLAYQVYLLQNNHPTARVRALLVMPEKSGQAYTDHLPSVLKPYESESPRPQIPEANQELLAKVDVSDLVMRVLEDGDFARNYLPKSSFSKTLEHFNDLYFNERKANTGIGHKCKSCEFRIEIEEVEKGRKSGFNECWEPFSSEKNPSKNHIFNLIGPGTNKRLSEKDFYQKDIDLDTVFSPESIRKGKGRISQEMRQALQIYKSQDQDIPEEIVRPRLFEELDRWQYPLHFLDFEAGNYAVPVRRGHQPYDLLLFQFSCHTLFSDGRWRHYQWIDDFNTGYPNYELIRRLMEVPHIKQGTIVQYSNFERHALKAIRKELTQEYQAVSDADDLIIWIENIINRHDSSHSEPPYVADLSRLVRSFYYNREMEDSLSIKDVLSSVMSHSRFLKSIYTKPYSSNNFKDIIWWQSDGEGGARNPYKILTETGDSPVRRGTQAMVVYGKLLAREYSAKELEAYQQALLKYCELDTLAMMMIFQHWEELMEKNR